MANPKSEDDMAHPTGLSWGEDKRNGEAADTAAVEGAPRRAAAAAVDSQPKAGRDVRGLFAPRSLPPTAALPPFQRPSPRPAPVVPGSDKQAQVLGSWASSSSQGHRAPASAGHGSGSSVGAFGPVPKSNIKPKDPLRGTMMGVGVAPPPAMSSDPPTSGRPGATSAVPIGLAPPPAMSAVQPRRAEGPTPSLAAPPAAGRASALGAGNQPTVPVMQAVVPEVPTRGQPSVPSASPGGVDPAGPEALWSHQSWRAAEDETQVNLPLADGDMGGSQYPVDAFGHDDPTRASWPGGVDDADGVESASLVAAGGGSPPYDDPLLDSVMPPSASPSGGFDLSTIEQWDLPEVPRPPSAPSARRFSAQAPPEPAEKPADQAIPVAEGPPSLAQPPVSPVLSPRPKSSVLSPITRAELAADVGYGASPWGKRLLWGGLASAVLVAGVMFVWPLWETVAPVRTPAKSSGRPLSGVAASSPQVPGGPGAESMAVSAPSQAEAAAAGAAKAEGPVLPSAEGVEPVAPEEEAIAASGAEVAEPPAQGAEEPDLSGAPGAPDAKVAAATNEAGAATPSPHAAPEVDAREVRAAQREETELDPDIQALVDQRPGKVLARAQSLLRAQRPARAEALARALLARRPKDHHVMEVMVQALLAQDRGAEGVEMAESMVQRRSRRASYHVLLGRTLLAAGREGEAKAALRRALALDPSNRAARHFIKQASQG